MAITEFLFPALKNDKASVEMITRIAPIFRKKLTHPNPGFLQGFRGFVVTENGKDVREDFREIVIFEWDKMDSFHHFVKSDQLKDAVSSIKHLMNGPPTLQLFDTNVGPKDAASSPIVEIIQARISKPDHIDASLKAWEKLSGHVAERQTTVTYGKSLNLENYVVAGIIGWQGLKEYSEGSQDERFLEALDSLKSLGEISRITVEVEAIELEPL
ncbi:hypothetical protein N7448_010766 [Penicillium atrosanguineum]|uniref:Uncharacterized protein n=1 Tax=Penicillium atrosanguineum TaxID=1132637 RepID=A0A9W9KU62_9EURO|nr:uncharacterized protein N7443_007988 [Penicillium atrosanguineum]KAJ5119058.1 hypothetical protein N7526_010695 [Penicillium atrosanguineum]KAJ5120097.1 hypothetical protein N7448_010766 [Penicillium atrosanguineum]KAJ5297095.1 hypothetical protein N7443_007988 [Penicillium atrosanguineum]KAJ5299854.1 hypothetical protein N7476_011411 [Penicillium atrosanguineum]